MFAQLNGRQVVEIQLYAQVRAELDGDKGERRQPPEYVEDALMTFAERHNAKLEQGT